MKFLDILTSTVRNSFRNKVRTSLTVVAIFIGAFTLTITSAIGTGVSEYIDTQVTSVGLPGVFTIAKAQDVAVGSTGPATYDPNKVVASGSVIGPNGPTGLNGAAAALTQDDLDTILGTKGILTVDPLVQVRPDFIEYGTSGKFEITVNTNAATAKADLSAGNQLNATTSDYELLIPTTYLENLGYNNAAEAAGSAVTIGISDFLGEQHVIDATVVGVQNESLFGSGAALNPALVEELDALQNTGKPASQETGYGAATATFDPATSDADVIALQTTLADEGFSARTVADQIGTFQAVIDGIIGVLNAFAGIALIAAGFGIINTLLMSVQERTREIGLMKAMGMSSGQIYALFSLEAVFIGFLGSAIGALVAIGIGTPLSSVLSETALSGLPGLNILQFAPASIAIILGIVMFIAFIAGTLPASKAARQNPIEALRYE
jgi:putative ABC transport system permease protein